MKTTITLFLLLIVSTAFADLSYYAPDLSTKLNSHALKNDSLKIALFDKISANQKTLGYDGARKIMFGKLFLKNDGSGNYISDVYCQKKFGASAGVGVGAIPNGIKINCEHTWPQSKFTSAFPTDTQKSDLHHLFPSDSRANSIRGNDDFTDVSNDSGELAKNECNISKFGSSTTGNTDGFEPPLTHKGNVARALFYFSVRYKISIPKNEEETLRRWNDLDPVDQEEMNRNDAIEKAQGNRNPFIDFPALAHDISKF
ncbi:MAG: endonuclease [Bacteriovorax sp.]|nr:endonuclease [Bacteriovorax sp.]